MPLLSFAGSKLHVHSFPYVINNYMYGNSKRLLHSRVKGQGSPTNLWLHGFFGSGANFSYVSRLVRGTNYLLDLRNHGDSFHATSVSSETAARDVLKFAERSNIEKFNLIGHSFGGRVATVAAHLAP